MRSYWLHSDIPHPLARLLQGLLPSTDDDPAWRDLVPHRIDHIDELAADSDDEWIRHVREDEGIVILCLRKKHPIISVISESGVCVVSLPPTFSNQNSMKQAHFLTGIWTDLIKETHRAKAGGIFRVSAKTGKIEQTSVAEC